MKFEIGQKVIVLNTEFKPAGDAVIRDYQEENHQYEVAFVYPDQSLPQPIHIPEERLLLPSFFKKGASAD